MVDKTLAGLRLLESKNTTIKDLKAALRASELDRDSISRELEVAFPKVNKRKKLGKASRRASARSFVLGFTDNHFSQIVEHGLSGGNVHNESVSRGRIGDIVNQANDIIGEASRIHGLNETLVWLGGDAMVNSDLHPHFRRMTPYEPLEELEVVLDCTLDIVQALSESSMGAAPIRIHGSLSNHGRDAKKEEVSAEIAYRRSYDVSLYNHLSRILPFPVNIERSFWGVESVGGVKCLLHHGHRLTLKDDPLGFIQPNWAQLRRRLNHPRHVGTGLYMQGHYHTATEILSEHFAFVSAGSTVGQDGFSYDLLYQDNVPSQPLVEIANGRVIHVHRLECP